MKKVILLVAVVILCIFGISVMKKCVNKMWNRGACNDLMILNDTTHTVSTAFNKEGKVISQVIKQGERSSGGCGAISVFVREKNGKYDLKYQYPRLSGQPSEVSLTQILSAAHTPNLGDQLYTEKGVIGDINVVYEEVRDMD